MTEEVLQEFSVVSKTKEPNVEVWSTTIITGSIDRVKPMEEVMFFEGKKQIHELISYVERRDLLKD